MNRSSAPGVSVVVPTYNRATYLPETLDSILDQQYPSFEVIVVDDGSTDETPDVVGRYGDRVRYHRQANQGQAHAVNAGLALATGDYLTLVSDDDPIRPGAFSVLVHALETDLDALVAYPDWELIDSDGVTSAIIPGLEFSLADMVRFHVCLPGPCSLFRRRAIELVGGWDPRWRWVADYDFWLRLALHGPFVRVPQVIATWRRHPAGATTATPRLAMAREQVEVITSFFTRDDLPDDIRALEEEAVGTAYMVGALIALDGVSNAAGPRFHVRDNLAQVLHRRVRRVGETTSDTLVEITHWQAAQLGVAQRRLAEARNIADLRAGEADALRRTVELLRARLDRDPDD